MALLIFLGVPRASDPEGWASGSQRGRIVTSTRLKRELSPLVWNGTSSGLGPVLDVSACGEYCWCGLPVPSTRGIVKRPWASAVADRSEAPSWPRTVTRYRV